MPANVSPTFPLTAAVGQVAVTAANVSSQGGGTIGTDIFLVETAGANGTFVSKVRFNPAASAAGTSTTATVGRIFLSTVSSGATTSANTTLLAEVALATQSAANSSTPTQPIDIPLNIAIPSGMSILATCHAAPAASTHWKVIAFSGDY